MTKYGVIVADPPWEYKKAGKTADTRLGGTARHYPTMSPRDLSALPVRELAANDAVLLLWGTWPQLDVAMDLMQSWGFKYTTGLPWIKITGEPTADLLGERIIRPVWGTGYWARACSELVLVGKRGTPKSPDAPALCYRS